MHIRAETNGQNSKCGKCRNSSRFGSARYSCRLLAHFQPSQYRYIAEEDSSLSTYTYTFFLVLRLPIYNVKARRQFPCPSRRDYRCIPNLSKRGHISSPRRACVQVRQGYPEALPSPTSCYLHCTKQQEPTFDQKDRQVNTPSFTSKRV